MIHNFEKSHFSMNRRHMVYLELVKCEEIDDFELKMI